MRLNGFHIETMSENQKEYLCLATNRSGNKYISEKMPAYFSGLYYTYISPIEINVVSKIYDHNSFILWHDRLDHPGSTMMHKIIENSLGHSLTNVKIPQS
ncbi:unnamed protein product, partial [Cuscuta epithymum]